MGLSSKIQEHFYHWVFGNNYIRDDEPSYLINLEHGISIRFNYAEGFFATFEEFTESIADLQFLNGTRPPNELIEKLMIDAWNYLAIEERIEDGFGLEDIDEDDILD